MPLQRSLLGQSDFLQHTLTKFLWSLTPSPTSNSQQQFLSRFQGQHPGDRHQREESWQPPDRSHWQGSARSHRALYYSYLLLLLPLLLFKELRNVSRCSFSLRTAGNSFEVTQPRAALSDGTAREENPRIQRKKPEASNTGLWAGLS